MNMNSHSFYSHVFFLGLALWAAGTIAIRVAGQHIIGANRSLYTMVIYFLSFLLMSLLVRRILRRLSLPQEHWPAAVTLLVFPTLLLDPFSCVFFRAMFPNIDPGAAGVFGGWMLMFCAGAVAGVWIKR
jgi:predicted neutral ceramidase superfamily lipid hydrolase